jgi:exonuclease III
VLFVSCHEDERHAARAKSVGYRIDHVAAQVDIENCCIEAAAILY